jgi:hypothetical protein
MVCNLINCRTFCQQIKLVPTHFSKQGYRCVSSKLILYHYTYDLPLYIEIIGIISWSRKWNDYFGFWIQLTYIIIPASNIMDSIDEALNLPKRIPRLEYRQYPRRGRGYNNNYNRGGGRGGSGRGFSILILKYMKLLS